jgi:hypothetical protein
MESRDNHGEETGTEGVGANHRRSRRSLVVQRKLGGKAGKNITFSPTLVSVIRAEVSVIEREF